MRKTERGQLARLDSGSSSRSGGSDIYLVGERGDTIGGRRDGLACCGRGVRGSLRGGSGSIVSRLRSGRSGIFGRFRNRRSSVLGLFDGGLGLLRPERELSGTAEDEEAAGCWWEGADHTGGGQRSTTCKHAEGQRGGSEGRHGCWCGVRGAGCGMVGGVGMWTGPAMIAMLS